MSVPNATTMERWAVRKRLRQLHQLLVKSRAALEQASAEVRDKWMSDLFFMLSCRRLIMLNLLDRELGTLGVTNKVGAFLKENAPKLAVVTDDKQEQGARMVADQVEEESYLKKELHDLLFQPGLAGRTRQMIVNLLSETEENMHDLDFIRTNLSSLRA